MASKKEIGPRDLLHLGWKELLLLCAVGVMLLMIWAGHRVLECLSDPPGCWTHLTKHPQPQQQSPPHKTAADPTVQATHEPSVEHQGASFDLASPRPLPS